MTMTGQLRGICLAASLLLCLVIPTGAKPASPPARRAIQAIYNKIDAALARKDVDTASDYDTDDCEYYVKGKQLDAGGGRQALEDLVEKLDTIHETTTITSFTGSETDATVTVKSHATARISNTINGRTAKAVIDAVSRDYWVKTDDGWRRKRSRQLVGKAVIRRNFQLSQ